MCLEIDKEKQEYKPMGGLIGPESTWQEKPQKQQWRKEETSRNDSPLKSTPLGSWLETRSQDSVSGETSNHQETDKFSNHSA